MKPEETLSEGCRVEYMYGAPMRCRKSSGLSIRTKRRIRLLACHEACVTTLGKERIAPSVDICPVGPFGGRGTSGLDVATGFRFDLI